MKKKTTLVDDNILQTYYDILDEYKANLEKAKDNYQKITAHLSDIQRIDMLPSEDRQNINEVARKVLSLTKIRKQFQDSDEVVKDAQLNTLSRYEKDVANDIIKIKECEEYQDKINEDLELLINEKKQFDSKLNNINMLKGHYKKLGITSYIMILILFISIIILKTYSEIQLNMPFFLTIIFGGLLGIYVISGYKRTDEKRKTMEIKINRLIVLQNQVKIKSANNLNLLNYYYEKYNVASMAELKIIWKEYVRIEDMLSSYRGNTQSLNNYQEELTMTLAEFGITYPDFWNHFPEPLVNEKEMVEIRHEFNKKRKLARMEIDNYSKEIEEVMKEINRSNK